VYIGADEDRAKPGTLAEVSVRGNGVVVFLEGCSTRDDAEAKRGLILFMPAADVRPSSDGRPRVNDLLGCAVVTQEGTQLGTITDVYDVPGNRVLGVDTGTGEVLVPDVEAWIASVDINKKIVTLVSDELFRGE
jgi:16S rRNA processing protein RimM